MYLSVTTKVHDAQYVPGDGKVNVAYGFDFDTTEGRAFVIHGHINLCLSVFLAANQLNLPIPLIIYLFILIMIIMMYPPLFSRLSV